MDNYQLLTNAIIRQAAIDYQNALIKQKRAEIELDELKSFFLGDDMVFYSDMDGEKLMNMIRKEVIDRNYSPIIPKDSSEKKKKELSTIAKLRKQLLSSVALLEQYEKELTDTKD